MLHDQESLVEFGSANEIDMLNIDPGSASGEGTFAVTNHRSLFAYEDAAREIPTQTKILEIPHDSVQNCSVEKAWAGPSGEVRFESDAPSREALREIEVMGFSEMAVVKFAYSDGSSIRRPSFITGRFSGANWSALVNRFRQDPSMPEAWEPPRLPS